MRLLMRHRSRSLTHYPKRSRFPAYGGALTSDCPQEAIANVANLSSASSPHPPHRDRMSLNKESP